MKRLSVFLLIPLLAVATNVFADNLKIGVVNVDEVVRKAPLAISYNEKMSKEFKPRQDELNTAQQKLQNDLDQLNYNSYQMSADDRAKLQATINDDKRSFDSLNQALQRDTAAAQSQYSQAVMSKMNDVLTKIAKDGHYDIIQTTVNMLYLNDKVNLTAQVIDQLK